MEVIRWKGFLTEFLESTKITKSLSFRQWQKDFFSTANTIGKQIEDLNVTVAPKQIYLYGNSRVGKTSTFQMLTNNKSVVFSPPDNNTWFSGFVEERHKIIFFEDFNYFANNYKMSALLNIMEWKQISVDVKYKNNQVVTPRCLVIFISQLQL